MDVGVPMNDKEATLLSCLVHVYIGLRMRTSIRAMSEQNLLHCSLTSQPSHHASRRWIVEKAIAAKHDTMHNDVIALLHATPLIAFLLDGSDRQRHRANEYAILLIFPGKGTIGMSEVFLGVVDVEFFGEAEEVTAQVEGALMSWYPDRAWWARKLVTFAVDGASNLGVRGATTCQVVDLATIESNVFALLVKWLVLLTPLGEPCHMLQRKLAHALELAGPRLVQYLAAVERQRALYNGARQWTDLQKCVHENCLPDTPSGLRLIPANF